MHEPILHTHTHTRTEQLCTPKTNKKIHTHIYTYMHLFTHTHTDFTHASTGMHSCEILSALSLSLLHIHTHCWGSNGRHREQHKSGTVLGMAGVKQVLGISHSRHFRKTINTNPGSTTNSCVHLAIHNLPYTSQSHSVALYIVCSSLFRQKVDPSGAVAISVSDSVAVDVSSLSGYYFVALNIYVCIHVCVKTSGKNRKAIKNKN